MTDASQKTLSVCAQFRALCPSW